MLPGEDAMTIRIPTVFTLMALASACTTTPAQLPPVPDGASLRFEVAAHPALDRPSASNGGTTAANMAGGTAAGVGLGAAYGAYLGLGCGPLLVVCSPIMAVGGAMGGGIAGLGIGTVEAVRLAIPGEKADAMNAVIERTFAEFDFAGTLDAEFRAYAGGRWRYSDLAPVDLAVSIVGVDLDKHPGDRVSVRVLTVLELVDRSGKETRTEERRIIGESPARHIDEWLAADGELFAMELETAIARAAREMIVSISGY
jgi:hypothetical protein